MRILVIARGTPSARDPQWGSFELDQAIALKNAGHEVAIISVDRRFRLYWRKIGVSRYEIDGIQVYNSFLLPTAITKLFGGRVTRFMRMTQADRLFSLVMESVGRPDVIYSHYLPNTELGVHLKKKYDIPVVGIEHWSKMGQENLREDVYQMAKRTYAEIDALITVSNDLQTLIKKNLGVDSYVVNNLIGAGFEYVERKRNTANHINFISTGNLLPIKGFKYLISAFALLDVSKSRWSLRILGGGTEMDRLQEQIDKLDLTENVKLLGRKQKSEVIRNLHESDVFIVSSLTETFGVAALEALACGLPVISTECGGPRDFITDENGVFCKVANPQSMADAITYMLNNYQRYDCKRISETTNAQFSQQKIAQQLTDIFEFVLQKNKE